MSDVLAITAELDTKAKAFEQKIKKAVDGAVSDFERAIGKSREFDRQLNNTQTAGFEKAMDRAERSAEDFAKDSERKIKTHFDGAFNYLGRRAKRVFGTINGFSSRMAKRGLFGGAVVTAGAIKGAVDLEQQMASVRKTTNATIPEAQKLFKTFEDFSKQKPVSVKEQAALAVGAGQLGIDIKKLPQFVQTLAKLKVASEGGISGDEGARQFGKFLMQFKQLDNADKYGSVLTELGNKAATTEGKILSLGQRIQPFTRIVKMSAEETLAWSASLLESVEHEEMAGTAFGKLIQEMKSGIGVGSNMKNLAESTNRSIESVERFVNRARKALAKGDSETFDAITEALFKIPDDSRILSPKFYQKQMKMARKQLMTAAKQGGEIDFATIAGMDKKNFSQLFNNNAGEAIRRFLVGLQKKVDNGENVLQIAEVLGLDGERAKSMVASLAAVNEKISKNIGMAREAVKSNEALNKEFDTFSNTTGSRAIITWNNITAAARSYGNQFLESINKSLPKINMVSGKIQKAFESGTLSQNLSKALDELDQYIENKGGYGKFIDGIIKGVFKLIKAVAQLVAKLEPLIQKVIGFASSNPTGAGIGVLLALLFGKDVAQAGGKKAWESVTGKGGGKGKGIMKALGLGAAGAAAYGAGKSVFGGMAKGIFSRIGFSSLFASPMLKAAGVASGAVYGGIKGGALLGGGLSLAGAGLVGGYAGKKAFDYNLTREGTLLGALLGGPGRFLAKTMHPERQVKAFKGDPMRTINNTSQSNTFNITNGKAPGGLSIHQDQLIQRITDDSLDLL